MASNENYEIPESGAVFTYGRSGFADNQPSHFFIRNDPIIEMSCGDEHTAVVCANGRVFLFGQNDYGQLGLGHTKTITKPSCLKYLKPFHSTHVACGKGHTVVSTKCRRLFSFGSNSDGQLGSGDLSDKIIPQLVNTKNLGGGGILAVSAGCFHSACLTDNGELYMWGSNSEGQCGTEVDTNLLIPTKIEFKNPITSVSCGYYHTAFIKDVGCGQSGSCAHLNLVLERLDELAGKNSVLPENYFLRDGNLYTFGEEDNGKLGYRKADGRNSPLKVELDFLCAQVECGGSHTLVLSDNGRVYGFGSNFSGQLGIPTSSAESYSPISLDFPEDIQVVLVSAGESHSAFITKNGELYTCGDGRYGKTCSGDNSSIFMSPTFITLFSNFQCVLITCGGCQTMILARPNHEDRDFDNAISQNNTLALPPLKVKKTLTDPVNIMINEQETSELQDRSVEDLENHSGSNENNIEETENNFNQRDSASQFDDVYVDIQGMYDSRDGDIKKIEMAEDISDTKMNETYKTAAENNVVLKPDGKVKKLFNVFKSKKFVTESTTIFGSQDGSENHTKSDNSKIGGQNRSRACTII